MVKDAKGKLLAEEFFNPNDQFILPPKPQNYDIKNVQTNPKFLNEFFQRPESVLPLSNLADVSFVTGKYQDSLILNDMSIGVLKEKDPGNILKFKILA